MSSGQRQKRCSYAVIHIFMFLSGVEYAVIFPSLWEYLQYLGVPSDQTYWFGLCLSSMTVTDMFTGLLVGRLMDIKQYKIKVLVMLLNMCQIAGSSLYLVSYDQYLVMISRLVSGIGKSITIVFLTDICRSTQLSERTPILLLFNIAFQIGLLIGPGCNLVLSQIEIDTAVGRLDKLNSPGLLLCICWIVFSIMVMAMYSDLDQLASQARISGEMEATYREIGDEEDVTRNNETGEDNASEKSPLLRYTDVNSFYPDQLSTDIRTVQSQDLTTYNASPSTQVKLSDVPSLGYGSMASSDASQRRERYRKIGRSDSSVSTKSNRFINAAERLMWDDGVESDSDSLESQDDSNYDDISVNLLEVDTEESGDNSDVAIVTAKDYIRVLMSEGLLCLIYLRFIALFCQTCLESIVPPVMQKYFDYGDQANSILYLLCGIELIIVFLVLSAASKKFLVPDRNIIVAGLVLMLTALVWMVATLPRFSLSDRSNLPYFAVGVIIDLAGIPTVCDIGLSLYSKLLPDNMQV